jgi:hydrogenase maturation protease
LSSKVAVIGLGNTLRRDDGIGIAVLESLLTHFECKAIDYLNFGTASFDLVYRLKDYETALLIDGIDAGLPAGELRIFTLDKVSYVLSEDPISSHELNLKGLFQLCEKLKIKTRIYVAGIQVKDISFGEGLSAELAALQDQLTAKITDFITSTLLLT